jgi:hypothetical protein
MKKQHSTKGDGNKVGNLKTQPHLEASVFFESREFFFFKLTILSAMYKFKV